MAEAKAHQTNHVDWTKIAICGAGFFADSYDLYVINVVVDQMAKAGYKQPLTVSMKSTVKTMALAGNVVGQLAFGAGADVIGRRTVFIMTCVLVIVGALLSATIQDTDTFGIYSQLCLWRFILGVGIGGEYPLSASITNESSRDEHKARNLAAVFSMQGVGYVFCAIVLVIVTQTLGDDFDSQWRIALGLGGLPMMVAFYFRWKMHETSWAHERPLIAALQAVPNSEEAVDMDIIMEEGQQVSEKQVVPTFHLSDYLRHNAWYLLQVIYNNRLALLGTAGSWFILDIVFYANSLFSGQVTSLIGFAPKTGSASHQIQMEALGALIVQSIALPGYWCAIVWMDTIGLRNLQLIGFGATTFFFGLLAVLQPQLAEVESLYVIIYGFSFFFQNFGANTTTYIIPAIVFPTAERGTCHGISAACGKLGAILGTQVFLYLLYSFCDQDNCDSTSTATQQNNGLQLTFGVCSALGLIGFWFSYYLVFDDFPLATATNNVSGKDTISVGEGSDDNNNNTDMIVVMDENNSNNFMTIGAEEDE